MSFDIGDAARLARQAQRMNNAGQNFGRGGGRRSGFGCFGCLAPIIGLLIFAGVAVFFVMQMFKSEVHDTAMEQLEACPASQTALGDNIRLRVGMFTGSSETNGGTGTAAWTYPVQGDSAQGDYVWTATRANGDWTLNTAILTVGDATIDVVNCYAVSQPAMPANAPQPGMQPGMQQPGMQPGMQQPGMQPGMQQPGMQPGQPAPTGGGKP